MNVNSLYFLVVNLECFALGWVVRLEQLELRFHDLDCISLHSGVKQLHVQTRSRISIKLGMYGDTRKQREQK